MFYQDKIKIKLLLKPIALVKEIMNDKVFLLFPPFRADVGRHH
jgi:hypothetical protein